ncbi:8962_t:CDS:1, partial [Funneliformis geosporum]
MAVDRFGSYIDILPILRYPVIEKNILLPDTLYVVFLHWDENQVYYKTEVYRLYGAHHQDLSQFA